MNVAEKPKSDLKVRATSAVVMVAVAGAALWVGGPVFTVFVGLIALGLLWEWWGLVSKITANPLPRVLWMLGGLAYIGQATMALNAIRNHSHGGLHLATIVILTVVAIDVGAYFAGRTFGGPKIAPSISPSKTWSGLVGGMLAAGVIVDSITIMSTYGSIKDCNEQLARYYEVSGCPINPVSENNLIGYILFFVCGACVAIVAQAGDFFESWMKRRAGVKDSGNLIPGHGGLLDRADGMLAVLCFVAIVYRFFR